MNLLSLLDRLSTGNAPTGAAPRRQLLRQMGQAGWRAAAAALPLVALTAPAQAATTDTSLDAILLLLKLEELLSALYTQALASSGVLASPAQASVRPDFERMLRQQQGHAQFYRSVLSGAGLTPPAAPGFDFSGRRNNAGNPVLFPNVLTDYAAFLQLAQQLEDASASIYLGQASAFAGDRQLLSAALRTQSVEARHASHVRTLRRGVATSAVVKSWPSNADTAPNPAVMVPNPTSGGAPVSIYTFEANENQPVSSTSSLPFAALFGGANAVQFSALSEAFDEPLPTAQATALLSVFG